MTVNVIAIRECDACGNSYSPTSSRQKICFVCTPDKGWQARYRRYGVTKPEFDQMLVEQDNKCLLCLVPFIVEYDICIDHCHKTGKNRGLLCRGCNMVVARFEDENYAARVALYLIGGGLPHAEEKKNLCGL